MRIVILGCGGSAGVPMLGGTDGTGKWGVCDPAEPRNRRTRSSILIEAEAGGRLLVDTGPDLREQLLRCGIGWVDALLYTHAHADHVAGLDEVRGLNRAIDRPIETFGVASVLDEIGQRFAYAFKPWRPPYFFRPVLVPRVVSSGQTLSIGGLNLGLFEQNHGQTSTLGLAGRQVRLLHRRCRDLPKNRWQRCAASTLGWWIASSAPPTPRTLTWTKSRAGRATWVSDGRY